MNSFMLIACRRPVPSTTNGGKSTLSQSLQQRIPNSCIIAQDTFFKVLTISNTISNPK